MRGDNPIDCEVPLARRSPFTICISKTVNSQASPTRILLPRLQMPLVRDVSETFMFRGCKFELRPVLSVQSADWGIMC